MEYSLPYICVLTIFGICAFLYDNYQEKEIRRNISIVAVAVFYIFFAFRGYVYSDWTSYADLLRDIEWGDVFSITNDKQKAVVHEPGFSILCMLCKSIINEYAFLVIVITTIDMALFLRFLRRWQIDNVPLVFMLFITFSGIGMMFNLMRNQIAIFIFLNALEYIEQRKPLPYFLLCTLALCFHLSSLVYFPLYFVLNRKLNKYIWIGCFFFFFLFYVSGISLLEMAMKIAGLEGAVAEKVSFYTEAADNSRAFSPTGTLEKFTMVGLLFCYYDTVCDKFRGGRILMNSVLIYFFFYYVFGEFLDLSQRMGALFLFSYWLLWTYLFRLLKIPNNRRLAACTLFLYCLYVTMLAYPTPIQQYDNLLFGGMSQEERLKIINSTFDFN